jgi:hypothetical protein
MAAAPAAPRFDVRPFFVAGAALALLMSTTTTCAYQAVDVADGGAVTGTVRYQGDPPAPVAIRVTTDAEVCGDQKTSPNLIVGSDKGIANVVVRLADIQKGKPLAKTANVTFDQKGCEYSPHVLLFPAGSTIRIQNDDGILHNTQVNGEVNRSFNVAQPKSRRVVEKRIVEPEMAIRVQCDVHRWMRAWWIAQEHPYYAVTDAHGAFALDDVPPGTYRLELWHESLGKQSQSVTVEPRERVTMTLEMAKR